MTSSLSFSVALTTHKGDNRSDLKGCFDSLEYQSRTPDEVLVVRGEYLPEELVEIIKEFDQRVDFAVRDIIIEEKGRGYARSIGVESASFEHVAIVDADDISCPHRFQTQLEYFEDNPDTDFLGGYIGEFSDSPDRIQSIREVPTNSSSIRRMTYIRCPINHPTVMFSREAVLEVGNYRNLEFGEDHELCCRLLNNGKKIANIPQILTKVRAANLIERRSGGKIARREYELQRAIVQTGFYGWPLALFNLLIRIPLRFLPKRILSSLYQLLFRSKKS